jgi:hypothetical protein
VFAQEEHHRKMTFQDELRRLLQRYKVEYDERYLWDLGPSGSGPSDLADYFHLTQGDALG